MKSTLEQIENIKRNGYTIDFAVVFNHAFENYKKIALYSALIILVLTIILASVFIGIAVAYYGAAVLNENFVQLLTGQKQSYIELFFSTLAISAITALMAPFGAGFLKMADSAEKDKAFDFAAIFTYYKTPYFTQIFSAAFIIAIISNAIGGVIDSFGIYYLGTAIAFMVSFFTFLAIPFIIFGKLNALNAIESSLVVVGKNPLMIFALFITGFICSFSGILICFIGILFTVVFNTSMTYATYFSIFTEEEKDSIDSIGKSDVE